MEKDPRPGATPAHTDRGADQIYRLQLTSRDGRRSEVRGRITLVQ